MCLMIKNIDSSGDPKKHSFSDWFTTFPIDPIDPKCGANAEKKKSSVVENELIELSNCTQSRDRTGMDVITLVFETSASTNSATRAGTRR